MGIRYLNKYLCETCNNNNNNNNDTIKIISMSQLSGKKIAVDISIYLYKYIATDQLIENIYLMLSIFKYYDIIPVFIFDGKPPTEKKELIIQRLEEKKLAEKKFKELKNILDNPTTDEEERKEIINTMDLLKKKFIYISKNQIQIVKNLIRFYGMTYFDAPGEADKLCAILNIKGKVWGCLSEDMDMFVYGCKNVLRYLSLNNHTVVWYETKNILNKLNISQKELKEICILSGTDYNLYKKDNSHHLYNTLKYFNKFKNNNKDNYNFYDWLLENTDYVEDFETLKNTYDLFDLENEENINIFNNFKNVKISNGIINYEEMYNILKQDGFIL